MHLDLILRHVYYWPRSWTTCGLVYSVRLPWVSWSQSQLSLCTVCVWLDGITLGAPWRSTVCIHTHNNCCYAVTCPMLLLFSVHSPLLHFSDPARLGPGLSGGRVYTIAVLLTKLHYGEIDALYVLLPFIMLLQISGRRKSLLILNLIKHMI